MTRDRSRDRSGSALNAESLFGITADRKLERKERQLCRQVQEAVSEALAGIEDDVVLEVWVSAVEPPRRLDEQRNIVAFLNRDLVRAEAIFCSFTFCERNPRCRGTNRRIRDLRIGKPFNG